MGLLLLESVYPVPWSVVKRGSDGRRTLHDNLLVKHFVPGPTKTKVTKCGPPIPLSRRPVGSPVVESDLSS